MDTSRYIQSCNPARFVITSSLLIFSILFVLRLDEYIRISYWLVFLPLFLWKMLVILGACTGVFVWCKNVERNRLIHTPDNDCRALISYFFLHAFIFTFELLTCDKLENHLETKWIICFTPLLLCTFLSFSSCLWSLKVQKTFLIQAFISINGLFFLFLPLRLDNFLTWRYVVVFAPVWVSLCIALFFVILKLIFAIIHRCSRRFLPDQLESSTVTESLIYALMFIPLSIFTILLVDRLDDEVTDQAGKLSFTLIAIPLWITLMAWLAFSFGATDVNPWWFGLRRDLCDIILSRCPSVSLYFNNQFKLAPRSSTTNRLIIDLTTTGTEKYLESTALTKLIETETSNESKLTSISHSISLLEPD